MQQQDEITIAPDSCPMCGNMVFYVSAVNEIVICEACGLGMKFWEFRQFKDSNEIQN